MRGTTLTTGPRLAQRSPAQPVTLTAPGTNPDGKGNANNNVDFGVFEALSIGNYVWYDVNRNGVLDPGESKTPGIPVDLLDNNGNVIASTPQPIRPAITSSATFFRASTRSGFTPPAGFTPTTGIVNGQYVESSLTLSDPGSPSNPDDNGLANLQQNFGLSAPAGVSGYVYRDPNDNGMKEAGETGIGGVTVTLTGTDPLETPCPSRL